MSPNGDAAIAGPVDNAPARTDVDQGDSGYGGLMFLVFTAAVLLVTVAVCVLAVVGSWWMLGVAVAIHVIVTALVMRVVYGAFDVPADADVADAEAPSPTPPLWKPVAAEPGGAPVAARG